MSDYDSAKCDSMALVGKWLIKYIKNHPGQYKLEYYNTWNNYLGSSKMKERSSTGDVYHSTADGKDYKIRNVIEHITMAKQHYILDADKGLFRWTNLNPNPSNNKYEVDYTSKNYLTAGATFIDVEWHR